MASESNNLKQLSLTPSTDFDIRNQSINGLNDAKKVQGKKVVEERIHQARTRGMELGSTQVEAKWDSVSSYCKIQGVNRGPIQCQRRWSNLFGYFKKIKEWESQIKEEKESFWMIRNNFKREKKLLGFFDRQVFDILDHGNDNEEGLDLTSVSEVLSDSGRSVFVEDDGLFSDVPQKNEDAIPMETSEELYQPLSLVSPTQAGIRQTTTRGDDKGRGLEGSKGKRNDSNDEKARNVQHHLVKALQKNGKMVSSPLKAQIMHSEWDREQRKDHVDKLVVVLNKLACALEKIADKL
uniref:Myb/SANT-like DNA-binding domain-containing protein n=1 Tax=Solanum lycopersicum TaxID=4081 RepID=A0A3Q7EYY2_SOLLC